MAQRLVGIGSRQSIIDSGTDADAQATMWSNISKRGEIQKLSSHQLLRIVLIMGLVVGAVLALRRSSAATPEPKNEASAVASSAKEVRFETEVLPIFMSNCVKCHGPGGSATADLQPLTADDVLPIMFLRCTACHGPGREDGGLDLSSREAMLKGGK